MVKHNGCFQGSKTNWTIYQSGNFVTTQSSAEVGRMQDGFCKLTIQLCQQLVPPATGSKVLAAVHAESILHK